MLRKNTHAEITRFDFFLYICHENVNQILRSTIFMNSINAKSSRSLNNGVNQRPVESVETAGSLAFNTSKGLISIPQYDSFTPSNPFAPTIDYSNYSTADNSTSGSSGFLSSFSNAVACMSSDSGFSGGASAGFSGGGCASSCSSGGFSSFV